MTPSTIVTRVMTKREFFILLITLQIIKPNEASAKRFRNGASTWSGANFAENYFYQMANHYWEKEL